MIIGWCDIYIIFSHLVLIHDFPENHLGVIAKQFFDITKKILFAMDDYDDRFVKVGIKIFDDIIDQLE